MSDQNQRELVEELAHWTQYGYIEGAHDVETNYLQAVEYLQDIDKSDGVTRAYPPLSDILHYYRERVQELRDKQHQGQNMITGGEYIEIDQLNDMLTNSAEPKIRY
ncbi:hypothetical protein [Paenibacillus glucanolyticus]|uniref:hypothetical protein n=1 Tax=Paenibacillus glucanolyticus TaxID=59843 RepID=UPI0009700160|nr:hypothetical protein [Paenibacillus glucanolyticus]OMF76799.1 hypothetical protein BK142_14875 [Paenibacillus glucanolyticus]